MCDSPLDISTLRGSPAEEQVFVARPSGAKRENSPGMAAPLTSAAEQANREGTFIIMERGKSACHPLPLLYPHSTSAPDMRSKRLLKPAQLPNSQPPTTIKMVWTLGFHLPYSQFVSFKLHQGRWMEGLMMEVPNICGIPTLCQTIR